MKEKQENLNNNVMCDSCKEIAVPTNREPLSDCDRVCKKYNKALDFYDGFIRCEDCLNETKRIEEVDTKYMQIKYDYPLPNDKEGKGYKFTEEELKELLDKAYENGLNAGKSTSESITKYTSNRSCSRCGKVIPDDAQAFAVYVPDLEGNVEMSFWCEDCYNSFMKDMNSFMKDMNSPSKAFKDVKPGLIDKKLKENVEKFLKARKQ